MTLGKPGGGEAPDRFFQPNAVAIASNGDIFVAQNHTAHDDKSRVLVFSPEGKFIKSFGGMGSGAGELDVPHALAFDANGRVLVGDRNHNRIALFDREGGYLGEWKQFSRPSGHRGDAGPDDLCWRFRIPVPRSRRLRLVDG